MNNKEQLNQYLSDLHVFNAKLHNLHWNVTGLQFPSIHKFTEELYEDVFEKFDAVAEVLKIQGEKPLVKVADYLKTSKIEEPEASDFTIGFVLSEVRKDLIYLKELAASIRSLSAESDDFETVNLMEAHISYYSKQLWFLRAMAV